MLDIEHQEKGNVTVVYFFGKIETKTSPEVQKYLDRLIDQGVNNIVMSFEELDFISSTGLRVILGTGKKLMGNNGKLTMCNANFTVKEVLRMSGFDKMFSVFETEEEALQSY